MAKEHTGYTNFVNNKNNNGQWVPTYLDKDAVRWEALAQCGWLAVAAYIELCYLGACWTEGWTGSLHRLGESMSQRANKRPGCSTNPATLKRAIDRMVTVGLLVLEKRGQLTVFHIPRPTSSELKNQATSRSTLFRTEEPVTSSESKSRFFGSEEPPLQNRRTTSSEVKSPLSIQNSQNTNRTKTEEEGGAGGNHAVHSPQPEAQHNPPVYTSECVSGAPTSTPMTPAGEEPVADPQADDACPGRHGETVGGPESAPPSDNVRPPPGGEPALALESGPALSDEELPPPDDDDLPDLEEDDDDWQDFARKSWDDLLGRPIRFDPETGEPKLVPRSEIPLALAAGVPTVDQVLFGETVPVIADPETALADSEESLAGETPDPGEGSNGAAHSHYESEGEDEPDGSVPDTGGNHDYYRADDSTVGGGENADDPDDDLPTGDPAAAPGDSGCRGGERMSHDGMDDGLERLKRGIQERGELYHKYRFVPRSEFADAHIKGRGFVPLRWRRNVLREHIDGTDGHCGCHECMKKYEPDIPQYFAGDPVDCMPDRVVGEMSCQFYGLYTELSSEEKSHCEKGDVVPAQERTDYKTGFVPINPWPKEMIDDLHMVRRHKFVSCREQFVAATSELAVKAPEPASEPPNREGAPGAPPGQMSLLGPSEGQESPFPERSKPTTPREVTEALVGLYRETTGRVTRKPAKRIGMIKARMADGFDLADMEQAMLGWWHDPFLREKKIGAFDWPFTSGKRLEECMQRFVDKAPIEAVEAFTGRTGRRIPEREAELEQRRQASEKLEADKAYWRKRLAEERRVRREGALREILPAIEQARRYEDQLSGLEGKDADDLRAYLVEIWARIRAKADLKGLTGELEKQGLLPRDKGKEDNNGKSGTVAT